MTNRIKPRSAGPLAPAVAATPASQAADAVAGKAGWKPRGGVPVKARRASALPAAGEKLLEKGRKVLEKGRKVAQKVQDGSLQRAIGGPLGRLSKAERRFLAGNLPLALPFREAADTTDAIVRDHARTKFSAASEKDASIYSDGAGNALRHATWNALMVKRAFDSGGRNLSVAAQKARGFADAHEDNPKNTDVVNKGMDLHNNQVGREVALEVLGKNPAASDQELFRAIVGALEAGRLREVSGDSLVVAG
jgi:hypothetical protein